MAYQKKEEGVKDNPRFLDLNDYGCHAFNWECLDGRQFQEKDNKLSFKLMNFEVSLEQTSRMVQDLESREKDGDKSGNGDLKVIGTYIDCN